MLHVEMWPIGRLKPYPGNPRVNDGAVDAVAESIRRFGFRQPIVVDAEGVIVAGHTRHRAAQKLGLAEVPVHRASDLTPEQTRALRIADSKTPELADWDFSLLSVEMESLDDAGFDWSALGFSGEELARMLAPDENTVGAGGVDPNESPEPPDADPVRTPIPCRGAAKSINSAGTGSCAATRVRLRLWRGWRVPGPLIFVSRRRRICNSAPTAKRRNWSATGTA